jgi:hypothetical protein
MVEGVGYAWDAWQRAVDKGYVWESVKKHAGDDFWAIAEGAIVGTIGGIGLVIVGQTGGAIAGSALGAYVSAGNPAAALALGQAGAAMGRTLAIGALQVIGVAFLAAYVIEHIGECLPHLVAAYDLCFNQCPYFAGESFDLAIDMAARMMAESYGIFCGLLLMAIVMWATHKLVQSNKSAESLAELANSKLEAMSAGLVKWLVPRLSELRQRMRPQGRAGLRVIEGGLPSSSMTPLQNAIGVARSILSKLVNPKSSAMTARNVKEMHENLIADGFRLIQAEAYGPEGGFQLFYQKGNVLVRFKSLGDAKGPRANQAHMSVGYNDGRGLAWQNDLAKFTATGKVEAKVISDAAKYNPVDFQGNPQKFVLLPSKFDMAAVDAWAARTHFNAPPGFGLDGIKGIAATAAP